jgi:hypothetical protein
MLDVSNEPILAEKGLKNPFFGEILKKWKNPANKIFFFFLLNQVGFSRFCNTLNTMVKEFLTSGTMRRVLHFANLTFNKIEMCLSCYGKKKKHFFRIS